MLETLKQLGREAEARRNEIDAARELPTDLVDQLKESGVLRLWVARVYGGHEESLASLVEAVRTLAYYEGSLGWVAMVTGTASLVSGYVEPATGAELFTRPDAMLGGWAIPAGLAQPVVDGLLVSGRWGWGSGTTHCTTVVGGIMIQSRQREQQVDEAGSPTPALAFFDPADVVWHDTWHTHGLQGTGSGDYEVREVLVPHRRWIPFPARQAVIDAPLYRLSFNGALAAGVASVAIGLAQRALDEFKALGTTKRPSLSRRLLAEKPVVQAELAQTTARYMSAVALLDQVIAENWAAAQNAVPEVETKAKLRLAATHAVSECAAVVDWCYKSGLGSTIWNGVKLQQLHRDMSIVTQHGLTAPSTYEMIGRVALGQPILAAII